MQPNRAKPRYANRQILRHESLHPFGGGLGQNSASANRGRRLAGAFCTFRIGGGGCIRPRHFCGKRPEQHAQGQVINLPEGVFNDATCSVDNDGRRRAAHIEAPHRHRDRLMLVWLINAYGKGQPIFMDEGFKCNRRHCGVMLENRVEPDHNDIGAILEQTMQTFGLRQAMRDTARTKHLKRMKDNDFAA
jgi:hypothetical protein